MLKQGTVLTRLYEKLEETAKNRRIADLRIGLSYASVKLDNGAAALAAILPATTPTGCTVLKEAGTYAGSVASGSLAGLIKSQSPIKRAIGLATANALIKPCPEHMEDREATSYFNLQRGERVAMVGLFSPLVERIRATGAILTVIEKNPERLEILSPDDRHKALEECDVAIITATTLLNNTFEEMINLLGSPRLVAMMGPSTPLMPEIFHDTRITHLGGAVVKDTARVMQIVSEGGGTPALRPYLYFVNLVLKP